MSRTTRKTSAPNLTLQNFSLHTPRRSLTKIKTQTILSPNFPIIKIHEKLMMSTRWGGKVKDQKSRGGLDQAPMVTILKTFRCLWVPLGILGTHM